MAKKVEIDLDQVKNLAETLGAEEVVRRILRGMEPFTHKTTGQLFEEFWKIYPPRRGVRAGKAAARKAWEKLAKKMDERELLESCKKSIAVLKETDQWKEDNGKYIPMASTYLNQRRFEDELEEEEYIEIMTMDGMVRRIKKDDSKTSRNQKRHP